ncbi:MAG: general stress protein CsbD [Chitinophagaceae bacterium]
MGTKLKLEAAWEEVKEKMKENNIDLTDDDLNYQPGKEDELLNSLAAKLKRTPEQVRMLIESISANKGRAS